MAILNDDQVEELKLAFEMFDEQQQGYLTKQDVKNCLDKFAVKYASKDLDAMYSEADVTGTGKLGFPEFMSMMARRMKQADSQTELLEAFRVFDPYGEGAIDEKELTEALTASGDKLSREELEEMYRVCRVDGTINYKSFINELYANK